MSLMWVTGGGTGGGTRPASSGGQVLKTGYIKKTKTMKKKFFVLRAECGDHPSCLEYYDSEKKWKSHQPPKRIITLQSCFNINRRNDLKQRYVVALYTKDDCFGLALDSEEEAQQWLVALLETQRGDDSTEGERPKPAFEHVWQVQVQKKGLGSSRNILGSYMLCLTSHSLTLVRNGSILTQQGTPINTGASEILNDSVEFSLSTIRRCGHSDCFFYMEVGRSSVTGAGELWMQTEDTNIAQNMHDAILHAMMSCRNSSTVAQKVDRGTEADLAPHPRTRSSSANEATKPVSVLQRGSSARYGTQSSTQSQHGFNVPSPGSISAPPQSAGWKPQALVVHATHHSSSGHPQRFGGWVGGGAQSRGQHQQQSVHHHHQQAGPAISPSQRRHSVSGMGSRERCDSLPSRARTISEGLPSSSLPSHHHHHHHPSPPSAAHSPSSHPPPPSHHHPSHHHPSHHHHPPPPPHLPHHAPTPSINSVGGGMVVVRGCHLVPGTSTGRPHSMYSRAGLSYSPPIISSPVSPASGACSTTDSAGSSLSMEEGEGWCGSNGGISSGAQEGGDMGSGYTTHGLRYGHSLTPDEPAIMEENVDEEYMPWVPGGTGLEMEEEYAGCGGDAEDEEEGRGAVGEGDEVDGGGRTKRWHSKKGGARGGLSKVASPSGGGMRQQSGDYVPMGVPSLPPKATPHTSASPPQQPIYATTPGSLSLPLQPLGRPCQSTRAPVKGQQGFKASPPLQQGAYMEMHSPCGASPLESADGYMPMSPVGGGGSGLPLIAAEEGTSSGTRVAAKQEDGYVPMTPGHPSDDGYVDMEPHQGRGHEDGTVCVTAGRGDMSPAASSCSVTSGTPSTDTRFSEYHLEKVSSYFTPSEEEEEEGGSARGSGGGAAGEDVLPMERPLRAYSVGSKPETFRRKNCLPVPNDRTNFHKSPSTSSTLEVGNVDAVRVRAFSVGSRQYLTLSSAAGSPLHHRPHHAKAVAPSPASRPRAGALSPKGVPAAHGAKKGSKSSSAPVLQALSSSWSGSSTLCSPPGSAPSPYSQPSGSALMKQGQVTHSNHNSSNPDHDLMELDFSGRREAAAAGRAKEAESPYVPMGVPPPPSSFSPPLLLSPSSFGGGGVNLEEYVDMDYSKRGGEAGGYMEMHPPATRKGAGDYVNMGGERARGSSVPEASRPIAIRKERREEGKEPAAGRGSSPNFSLVGLLSRKSSSGTPPKSGPSSDGGSPFASLRRSRKKRGAAEEEEDVDGPPAAGDLSTPTAIFPFSLNSPGSPVRSFPGHYESASKCPVDATSGTVHISYPFVPSSPVVTTGSTLTGRTKGIDVRRKSEYSLPGGVLSVEATRGGAVERVSSQLGESLATDSGTSSHFSAPEYTNCVATHGAGGLKPSDDYMPMAPSGRIRKESVVSGPANVNVQSAAQSSLMTPSTLFSSFSPSSKFTTSVQPMVSSDYVCMKAVHTSSSTAPSSSSSQRATATSLASQKTKSSSVDYMEIKLGSQPPISPPTPGNSTNDYVKINLSQNSGSALSQKSPVGQQVGSRIPKAISSSVGTYVPSHTGFGFLPHIPSPSSRLPPTPTTSSSYTWPRKGSQEARKEVVLSQGLPPATDQSKPPGDHQTDDYVLMNLGTAKPPSSSSSQPSTARNTVSGGGNPVVRRTSSSLGASTPPPSTTATVTATTTTVITSPRTLTKTTLVSSPLSNTFPPTLTNERNPVSSLPPSHKFALTSSSFVGKRSLPPLSSSTTPSSSQKAPTTTISNPTVNSNSAARAGPSTEKAPTTSSSSTPAVVDPPVLQSAPSICTPTVTTPSTAVAVFTPVTTSAPAPSPTNCCSSSSVSSCASTASSSCTPPTTIHFPHSCVSRPIVVVATCSVSTNSISSTAAVAGPCPALASLLAVSGPIAIPTRTSQTPHAILPSGPPAAHFADCTTTASICRVVTASSVAVERAARDEQPQQSSASPAVCKETSTAPATQAPSCPAPQAASLGVRGGEEEWESPPEGGPPPEAPRPLKQRGGGGNRRHSGGEGRPRRRSSDVSKGGGRGRGDAEDKSGSYEKLLVPGRSQQQQRKWGTHRSLGERAPSLGWGPLRRQLSSPSAVPDPDGAYEKLLPSNGGPSRRRSGDKLLPPADAAYSSPTPLFSASSSSASSSSSLASVASTILLAATSSPPAPYHPPPSPGEIHYASLDLAPPTDNNNDNERGGRRSPRGALGRPSGAESPSGAEQPLNYAEIDFSKSITSTAVKNRVRH